MVKQVIVKSIGGLLRRLQLIHSLYMDTWILKRLGSAGIKSAIHYPFNIIGANNIYLEEGVSIGTGSTLYTKKAKIHFGKNSFSGPNLTMISGDHPFMPGIYMLDLRKDDLPNAKDYDRDIIVGQDVWIGTNVTILKGVRIGRGAIIAAGSVVVHNVPPYAIAGGVPSKVLKFKWNYKEILAHENFLFDNNEDKLSKEDIFKMINTGKV